jgi:hypothetical protein
MKTTILSLALLFVMGAQAQTKRPLPAVPGVDAICSQLYAIADSYNKKHPEDKAMPMCGLGFSMYPKGSHEVHYALTIQEIDRLDHLRALSTVEFYDQDQYEKLLLRRHGHPELDFSNPNWHYIGIQAGKNYITEEVPNK